MYEAITQYFEVFIDLYKLQITRACGSYASVALFDKLSHRRPPLSLLCLPTKFSRALACSSESLSNAYACCSQTYLFDNSIANEHTDMLALFWPPDVRITQICHLFSDLESRGNPVRSQSLGHAYALNILCKEQRAGVLDSDLKVSWDAR